MRTSAVLVLFAVCFATAVQAQPGLSPDQLAAFDASRLYIEGIETRAGSVTGPVRSRTWNPLQGDDRISEREFYVLVGRDDLATRAASRRRTSILGWTVGAIATTVGLGLATYGSLREKEVVVPPSFPGGSPFTTTEYDYSIPMIVGGSALMIGGGVGMYIGARAQGRATHVQAAAEMAERYNDRLRSEMRLPTPDPSTRDI